MDTPADELPGAPTLQVDQLSVRYGTVQALTDVSLTLGAGEIVAVLGANGAGKTTLVRTISGLVKPSAGTIRFEGRDLAGVAAHRRARQGVYHVPEGRGVLGRMSVEDNLRIVLPRSAAVDQALGRVFDAFPALAQTRSAAAANLSGGQQQMLAIARAVLATPRVVLLDEPTLGLAPKLVAQVMALVADLRADSSVLLIEQNTGAALDLADRSYVLRLGHVVASGSSDQIRSDPALLQAYLGGGSMPAAGSESAAIPPHVTDQSGASK